ncbi:MAG: MBL fold metallo-hydrolase [Nocardioidaceae bacterium]
MRITKFGHACVRIEYDGTVMVIDPGCWTEPEAVDGADAVLVTHEHVDHLFPANLRATTAPIFTIEAVAAQIADLAPDVTERVTVVAPGDAFDAGLPVTAVGALHAVIYPELPRFANTGYVVQCGPRSAYHPGDALTPPDRPVDVLLLPVHAPWSKISEVADYARTVGAMSNLAVHDGLLNANGIDLVGRLLTGFLEPSGQGYRRIEPGTDL